jgi:ATP-dependent protease ClpP protease subunit
MVEQISSIEENGQREVVILVKDMIKADLIRFLKATKYTTNTHYRIVIMSGGGYADEAQAIMNQIDHIKRWGAKVTTECSVMCGSGAASIWLMGDERVAHAGDVFMFHEAVWYGDDGKPYPKDKITPEMQESIQRTNANFRQKYLDVLKDAELVNELLNPKGNKNDGSNMNWFTAQELYERGIIDKLYK